MTWKFSLILSNASSNFCREKVSISLIVACVFSIESSRSLRWVSRKRVTFGGFLEFFQSHHVDRAHGVEPRAHFPIKLIFEQPVLLRHCERDRLSAINSWRCTPKIIQAGLRHILGIGLQLGRGGGKFALADRELRRANGARRATIRRFPPVVPEPVPIQLQQAIAGFAGIAFGFEIEELNGNLLVLRFALQFFCCRQNRSARDSDAIAFCISATSDSIRLQTLRPPRDAVLPAWPLGRRCCDAFCAALYRVARASVLKLLLRAGSELFQLCALLFQPATSTCAASTSFACSERSAAKRLSSLSQTRKRSPTRVISESSCRRR